MVLGSLISLGEVGIMDPNVLHRLQNFKLVDEEQQGFNFDENDIQSSQTEYLRSLIAKIYGEKVANYTCLRNTLATMWSSIGPTKLVELGTNLY